MERLTEKIAENDYKLIKYNDIVRANARLKLGKLEDLEKQLGIDLITLFKALKNEIYLVYENTIVKSIGISILEECLCATVGLKNGIHTAKVCYFKDYGKTWALTKEELMI